MSANTIEISTIKDGRRTIEFEISDKLQILDDPSSQPPKGSGCMRIPTEADGDKRVIWDNQDLEQIAEAELTFNNLIAQGMEAYKVGIDGKKSSEKIFEFDPHAEEIIFVQLAMVAGG
jgi:hypothetical protein